MDLPGVEMHEQLYGHFGLQQTPFQVSPNPRSFVSVPAHDQALRQLLSALDSRKGLMLLTGEPGTGKTTILHYLLGVLKRNGYSTAYVFHTLLSSVGVFRVILNDFGIACQSNDKSDLLAALRTWLVKRHRARDCPVIVVDEAQGLSDRTLDDLRMLLNLEVSGVNLVQLVLAGQSELETKLRQPNLKQLRQRVMCQCRVPTLSFEDTVRYIRTRINEAGSKNPDLFTQESFSEIYRYSKGNPRVIHLLCDRSLLSAYSAGNPFVSGADIQQAAEEFELAGQGGQTELPELDSLSSMIPFPKLDATPTISHDESDGLGVDAPRGMPVPSLAAEPRVPVSAEEPRRSAFVANHVARPQRQPAALDESPLSLAQAVALVASDKFNAVERRRKDAVDRIMEAGRSVLWLRREVFPATASAAATPQRREARNVAPRPLADPRPRSLDSLRKTGSTAQRAPKMAINKSATAAAFNAHRNANRIARDDLGKPKVFVQYWQGVGDSLRRDIRQFLDQCGLRRGNQEVRRGPPR